MRRENNKGITLVALVITIVILIIIASVTISITLGDNGLVTRTKDAKEQTYIGQYKEKIELVKADVGADNEGSITLANLNTALNEKDWVNSAEINNSMIVLTTNDGYVFWVTESSTEYKGMGTIEVITAEDVTYTPDPTLNWTGVTNVKQALDYLYNN